MTCSNCGSQLNEGDVFCPKCGTKVEVAGGETSKEATATGNQNDIEPSTISNHNDNGPSNNKENPLSKIFSNKKIVIGLAGLVAFIVIICLIVNGSNSGVSDIEDRIAKLTGDVSANAEQIVDLYNDYNELSDSKKKKVANRETLLNAYNEAIQLIEVRKNNASIVDNLVMQIDKQNIYAEASTVKRAVIEYNKLDEYTIAYMETEDELRKCFEDVKDLNVSVTGDNFFQLYDIQFDAQEKVSTGDITSNIEGYTYDPDTNHITPDYNVEAHKDRFTPVYVYVTPRYPNLSNTCSFGINLHQTYNALGIIKSGEQEFKYQSRTITYDSSMGIGEYLVPVEINDASGGLADLFGMSYDIQDLFHNMNEFDASRVEFYDISGSVAYK